MVEGAENDKLGAWMDTTPAVIVNVQRQPGANVIATVDTIKALLPELQTALPAALTVTPLTDRTVTIRASVADVEFELGLAVALVVLVIFLFLRNLPATLIPSLSVPLSLVGTLAAMYLWGFSIDNLSLMALTIATGFVVDDAIVMIENIARYVEMGETPLQAALKGSAQIGFTIISLTVSLLAVLIPLLFMGEVVGRLFHEFAITLAVTIVISAVVSLTLVPMLCAKLLHHRAVAETSRFERVSARLFDGLVDRYAAALRWVLDRQGATLLVALATLVATVALYVVIPKGFFPVQDTDLIQAVTQAAPTTSYAAMADHQQALAAAILEDPDVVSLSSLIGVDGTNATLSSGRLLVNLKPRDQRTDSASAIIRRLQAATARVAGVSLYMQPVQDLTIDTNVSAAQYQFVLENPDPATFDVWVPKLLDHLRQSPELADVASDNQQGGLAAYLTIDRATAGRFGITPATVDNALYDAFGQRIVSTIFTQSNQYRVILEADPAEQQSLRSLNSIYLPSSTADTSGAQTAGSGQVPLSAIVTVTQRPATAADQPSGPVPGHHPVVQPGTGGVAGCGRPGHRAGGTGNRPARQLRHQLPGCGPCLPVLARQRAAARAGGGGHDLHRAGRALRELRPPADHPLHAAVGRRRRVAGADAGRPRPGRDRHHRHRAADRHRQEERDHDDRLRAGGRARGRQAPREAIYQACLLRFRPILMTTMAALLGALPLMLGTGTGAELRQPLGIAIVGGLIASQLLTLFTTPVIYLAFDRVARRLAPGRRPEAAGAPP